MTATKQNSAIGRLKEDVAEGDKILWRITVAPFIGCILRRIMDTAGCNRVQQFHKAFCLLLVLTVHDSSISPQCVSTESFCSSLQSDEVIETEGKQSSSKRKRCILLWRRMRMRSGAQGQIDTFLSRRACIYIIFYCLQGNKEIVFTTMKFCLSKDSFGLQCDEILFFFLSQRLTS